MYIVVRSPEGSVYVRSPKDDLIEFSFDSN